jgi:hypothetical protein
LAFRGCFRHLQAVRKVIYNIWGKLAGKLNVKYDAEEEAELTETGVSF